MKPELIEKIIEAFMNEQKKAFNNSKLGDNLNTLIICCLNKTKKYDKYSRTILLRKKEAKKQITGICKTQGKP